MDGLELKLLLWTGSGILILAALAVLRRPLLGLGKLGARTALGLGALALFSRAGSLIGVTLGVNLFNALALGLLGVPGFGLLLLLNWAVS